MASPSGSFSVGLISDTHGLLRPEALEALRGSRYIVHAGDIGDPAILQALARLAPVTAVRGNNDTGSWARKLGERGGVLYVNPGNAGPRRFSLPVSVGRLWIRSSRMDCRLIRIQT